MYQHKMYSIGMIQWSTGQRLCQKIVLYCVFFFRLNIVTFDDTTINIVFKEENVLCRKRISIFLFNTLLNIYIYMYLCLFKVGITAKLTMLYLSGIY